MAEQITSPVKAGDGQVGRRDPFELLENLQQEMERLWEDFPAFGPWPMFRPMRHRAAIDGWVPRLDVYEQRDDLTIKADLPGLKKEDIQVSLEQDRLVIAGERREKREVKDERYYRMERSAGRFYRSLALPFEVKPEQITASYRDGILEIHIPKPAEQPAAAKQIAIR